MTSNSNKILIISNIVGYAIAAILFAYILISQFIYIAPNSQSLVKLIKENYLYGPKSNQVYREGELKGLINSLQDPYSEYMTEKEGKDLLESINRKYEGVGIVFDFQETNKIKVISTIPNSPASEAGIKAGDILYQIDSNPVTDQSQNMIISKIKGVAGTQVNLKFFREGKGVEFNLIRRKIELEVATLEFKDNVAIIKVTSFSADLDKKVKDIIDQVKAKEGVKRILLDLRDNPGGYLDAAVNLISYFTEENKTAVQERTNKSSKVEKTVKKANRILDLPVDLLVNGGSASSSEIVAGALRDLRESKLYGKKTFGKGLVQQVFELSNKDSVKLTVAEWLTPNGKPINKEGLKPDFESPADKDIKDFYFESKNN